jgi:hypothetical protein
MKIEDYPPPHTVFVAREEREGAARRFLRYAGRPLGILFLLLLMAYFIANAVAGRVLERELAAVRAKGEPLTLREMAPPSQPAENNAALVYQKAFDLLRNMRQADANGQIVKAPLKEDQAALMKLTSGKPGDREKVTRAEVLKVLSGTEGALALVRKAAAMPEARFPVDWEAGAGATFPHHGTLRAASRMLAGHAELAAADGRTGDALADVEALTGIARHALDEPTLVSQMVGYATLAIADRTLKHVLETSRPTAEESRRLAGVLARIDLDTPFLRSLEGERAFGNSIFDVSRRNPVEFMQLVRGSGDGSAPKGGFMSGALILAASPVLKVDQTIYLRYMTGLIEREKEGHLTTIAAEERVDDFPGYAVVSRLVAPAVSSVIKRRGEAAARLTVDVWGLALHAYRLKTGRYPDTLRELESSFPWNLPEDPFTGQPLVYSPEGDGYHLYSVGANRLDEGGMNSREGAGAAAEGESRRDDIGWRFNF